MNYLEYSAQEQLISTFNKLSVPFVNGGNGDYEPLPPAELIAGLSVQKDARLRLALIPLFLSRPDLSGAAKEAGIQLSDRPLNNLRLYYTAAVYLQKIYHNELEHLLPWHTHLPDLFSKQLGLGYFQSAEIALAELGRRHAQLAGLRANWVGTYHHGAKYLIKRLHCEIAWGIR